MLKTRGPRAHAVLLTLSGNAAVLSTPVFRSNGSCSGFETEIFGFVSNDEDLKRWVRDGKREARDIDLPFLLLRSSEHPEWRSVFGRSKLSAAKFAEKHLSAGPLLSEDVAEAYCLRAWAERAPAVLKKIKELKAS